MAAARLPVRAHPYIPIVIGPGGSAILQHTLATTVYITSVSVMRRIVFFSCCIARIKKIFKSHCSRLRQAGRWVYNVYNIII